MKAHGFLIGFFSLFAAVTTSSAHMLYYCSAQRFSEHQSSFGHRTSTAQKKKTELTKTKHLTKRKIIKKRKTILK